MTELRFSWILDDRASESPFVNHGPLFTQWLPNGEQDSIVLNLETMEGKMYLWFDRCGYTDPDGYVHFDYKRREVDDSIVKRQGILDAGPLKGKVVLSADLLESVRLKIAEQAKNDPEVVAFIKPIVKEVNTQLIRLLEVLRYRYGQYWLPPIEKWDSKDYPLGVYCKYQLQLCLVSATEDTRIPVVPDDEPQVIQLNSIIRRSFPEYLTQVDWREIQANVLKLGTDSYLGKIVINSYTDFLDGDYRSAVVFGCTALELAIEYYYKAEELPKQLQSNFVAFRNLPLKTQAITVLLSSGAADKAGIFAYFIDQRNRVVHDGFAPPDDFDFSYKEFIESIGKYFLKRELKLPTANHGNALL